MLGLKVPGAGHGSIPLLLMLGDKSCQLNVKLRRKRGVQKGIPMPQNHRGIRRELRSSHEPGHPAEPLGVMPAVMGKEPKEKAVLLGVGLESRTSERKPHTSAMCLAQLS